MSPALFALALFSALLSPVVPAAPITGVTANTSAATCCGTDIAHITDGSGLPTYTPDAIHAKASTDNVWSTFDPPPGSLVFDLGGLFQLDGLVIWNFNSNNAYSVRTLRVFASTNGTSYEEIAGGPTSLQQGTFLVSPEPPQPFVISALASFVRFDITAAYGNVGFGLAEVMFLGTEVPRAAPEPASLALVLGAAVIGILGAGSGRRDSKPWWAPARRTRHRAVLR